MRARQLFLVFVALLLYGALTYSGYRIFLLVLLLIVFLTAASLAQLLWVRKRFIITQTLEQDPVFTGNAANLVVQIVNRSIWPVAALEIEIMQVQKIHQHLSSQNLGRIPQKQKTEYINLFAKKKRQPGKLNLRLFPVIGRSTQYEKFRLQTEETRIFSVGIAQIHIRDPFNLIRLPVKWTDAAGPVLLRLHVLPRPHTRLAVESFRQIKREGFHPSHRQSDEVNAIAELRKMRPGDTFKRIHWVVSAKQNQWMVKSFEKEEQGNVLIVPDLSHAHLPENLHRRHRNSILSVTAAAAEKLLLSDMALVLVTADDQIHTSYADRPDQTLDLLIHLSASSDQPSVTLNQQIMNSLAHMPDDTGVVIVSNCPSEELFQTIMSVIKSGHPVILINYRNPLLPLNERFDQLKKIKKTGARLITVSEHETKR